MKNRDPYAPTLPTWPSVLTHALALLDQADPRHRLTRVEMGTYPPGKDGTPTGHWVDLEFSYSLGSNLRGCAPRPIDDRETCVKAITDEWLRQAGTEEACEISVARLAVAVPS